MNSASPNSLPSPNRFRFSTDWIPAPDRVGIWREEFGQKIVRLDMEPLDDDPLYYDAQFQILDDVTIGEGAISSMSSARTKPLIQDGNDNIVLLIPQTDTIRAQLGQFDEALFPGDSIVHRADEVGRILSRPGRFITLALPVKRLVERIADVDNLSICVLPSGNGALHLLLGYCQSVLAEPAALSLEMEPVVRDHLLDLAALAIGANRDAWHMAQVRGVRAARLEQARREIRRNATDPAFRIADLVRAMYVSESYIRKILAENGETFSSLLRQARLEKAWETLTDPRHRDRQIGLIALDCGFSDISYFNRVFHREFGKTPTECRAARFG